MEEITYRNLIRKTHRAHYISQSVCDLELLLPVDIDEISLLFRSDEDMEHFLHHVSMDRNVDHFNSVPIDAMHRQESDEAFDVRFEFLRIHGADWRIEAMCVLGGTAPLHEKALLDRGSGTVVHASYKCEDRNAYVKDVEIGGRLGQHDGNQMATYINNYGMFSYWEFERMGTTYLKPRVNLRDVSPSAT